MEILVGVAGESERREARRLDRDAELLAQFADQRVLRPLAGVDLAAGELPQALELFALRPPGDQHAAVDVDQRRRDDQEQLHER